MSKLRVHDMAGEFGISSDEVITILRQMDVPVRSHLTLLTDDQVARIRARWEREKRVRAEKQTAPPARRRRGTAAAAPAAAAPPAPAPAEASGIRRRRRPAELVGEAGVATSDDTDIEVAAPDIADRSRFEPWQERRHCSAGGRFCTLDCPCRERTGRPGRRPECAQWHGTRARAVAGSSCTRVSAAFRNGASFEAEIPSDPVAQLVEQRTFNPALLWRLPARNLLCTSNNARRNEIRRAILLQ